MKTLAHSSLIALALAGAPLAAQTAPGGFRLPTPTPTPTDIQGPFDPDAPILTRPRDTAPTPTPTPRATPTPTPTPAPRPVATPTPRPVVPPSNSSLPPRFTPPAVPTPEESAAVTEAATRLPPAPDASIALPAAQPTASASAVPTAPADTDGVPGWLYAVGALLIAAGAGASLYWRRRGAAQDQVPEIAPPRVAAEPAPPPPTRTPAPPLTVTEPPLAASGPQLTIEARAVRLARSMVYATLSYEVVVTNRGAHPLTNVRLGADLVTAHARIPTDQQLADPLVPLAPAETIERLDPGQSVQVAGELRLPVNQIRPIPHGKAVVYVPLLRVRGEADGLAPIARTFVVGMRSAGVSQRLQPFRLDEMPQTYNALSQLALD